jgi:AraC-like DNA-binding protein
MADDRYAEIDEVIKYIHQNVYEPLTLSQLAKYIGYSPYHFSRIFKQRTGLSPLYYVSSLRLQKAKELLIRTHLSIRDIGLEIGQQSLGTFTTRFTQRVGVTPAQFRNMAQEADSKLHTIHKLTEWERHSVRQHHQLGYIEGTVDAVVPFEGIILIGLFPKPIPEGLPLHGKVLRGLGDFYIGNIKPGTYYLMATSVAWDMQAKEYLIPETTLRYKSRRALTIRPGLPVPRQRVTLDLPRLDDPPILISLPLLMDNFLHRVASKEHHLIKEHSCSERI